MEQTGQYVIEMLHITKEFPGIKANDDITLQLKRGEIHALLGENGAGKSTLMSVLFGLYQPEEGEIRKNGQKVNIPSYLLHAGDVVAFTEKARANDTFKTLVEQNSGRTVPMWLNCDKDNFKGTVERMPVRDDITLDVDEQLIVELYSK